MTLNSVRNCIICKCLYYVYFLFLLYCIHKATSFFEMPFLPNSKNSYEFESKQNFSKVTKFEKRSKNLRIKRSRKFQPEKFSNSFFFAKIIKANFPLLYISYSLKKVVQLKKYPKFLPNLADLAGGCYGDKQKKIFHAFFFRFTVFYYDIFRQIITKKRLEL